jgi:hypothetical protein
MKFFTKLIHDIKTNPVPFLCGILFGVIFTFPHNILPMFDFSSPDWKNIESIIDADIHNTITLLHFSTTDEETAIIKEMIAKHEEFKNKIPQGKKSRKGFLKEYNTEISLITSRYREFIFETEKHGIYKK